MYWTRTCSHFVGAVCLRWKKWLRLFVFIFFFREEKNVALAELRDELLASKKGLEALRQEVNKNTKGFFNWDLSWITIIWSWPATCSFSFKLILFRIRVYPKMPDGWKLTEMRLMHWSQRYHGVLGVLIFLVVIRCINFDIWGARVAQWQEHLLHTPVTKVHLPHLVPLAVAVFWCCFLYFCMGFIMLL